MTTNAQHYTINEGSFLLPNNWQDESLNVFPSTAIPVEILLSTEPLLLKIFLTKTFIKKLLSNFVIISMDIKKMNAEKLP